jgi:peptidoglycan/LPS O-acetylase OafA/YrhL
MRSTSGQHYLALDHVRALAAFLVFVWHFSHGFNDVPVSRGYAPGARLFFLAVFDEGHTGVALFMTLSGYLFAKLLDGKTIHYGAFLWNRALRLLPLLVLVLLAVALKKQAWHGPAAEKFASEVAWGWLKPSLPNGAWSLTVEFHFYLLLPLLLWLSRRHRLLPGVFVLAALLLRLYLLRSTGEVQFLSYWTLLGRIDQFVLGIVIFQFRGPLFAQRRRAHVIGALTLLGFCAFYWWFDRLGGYYSPGPRQAPAWLWVVIPTLEAVAYALLIAYYDSRFEPANTGLSRFIALIGAYSYSIYLLHFFFVFEAARLVDEHVMRMTTFPRALAWALVCFLMMMPLGYLSFRLVEAPFLRLRRRYVSA